MAWTVDNNLRNRLAGSAALNAAISSGTLEIRTSGGTTLLSTHNVGTVTVDNNVVTVPFNSAAVAGGVSNQDAAVARIRASGGDLLLSGTVGSQSGDVPFDDATGWNAGDTVNPGTATITLTVSAS